AMRWALAQSGPEAIRYLAKGMGDLSVEVRRNALQALDEIRRNTAKEELGSVAEATIIESLHSGLGDTDLQVRSSAALILGQMADPVAVSDLLEIAMDGPKDIEAAEALAAFVNEAPEEGARAEVATRIMSDLRRHARSPEATVRFRVLQVLIEIPGTEVDDFIVELSTDENLEVAATATATLNRRRDH
ncbi:MAG: HEAT repeat domain-containing protein, partial [Brevibacterium sp.]|nr:HEAT repeat domain-containing protein [Brevibacterium sp.]